MADRNATVPDTAGSEASPGVLALLVLLSVITYLDRRCIATAKELGMQGDLGISEKQWGWVTGAFLLAYGLFEIPTGAMGDRRGQRRVLTRVVLWWSAFTCITGMLGGFVSWAGLASGFLPLLATQFLFGAGEAGAYPNISRAIGRWFAPTQRARAQGAVWAASRVGGALSPLMALPISRWGWQYTFLAFGTLGLVWAAVWYRWYRDPAETEKKGSGTFCPQGPKGVSHKRSLTPFSPPPSHAGAPWRQLFGNRQMWLIMAMYACYVWGSLFYINWLEAFLVKGRGLTTTEIATFAALPFLMGMAGNLAGGWLSDRCVRRLGLRNGRRLVGSTCLAIAAAFLLATALVPGKYAAVVLLVLGFGVLDCMLPTAWALCLDVGGQHAGLVSGAMNTAGSAGGVVFTVSFGYLAETFGYNVPLLAIAAMVTTAAVLFLFIDATRQLAPPQKEIAGSAVSD